MRDLDGFESPQDVTTYLEGQIGVLAASRIVDLVFEWNDRDELSFEAIADLLELWARRSEAQMGAWVQPPAPGRRGAGFYAIVLAESEVLPVKVAERQGELV